LLLLLMLRWARWFGLIVAGIAELSPIGTVL
jgi:hypothetical protein